MGYGTYSADFNKILCKKEKTIAAFWKIWYFSIT